MNCPDFFNAVQTVTVYDPLADKLGAAKDGIITISYPEVVKLAGHSCPTVAGAYLMTLRGLEALYGDEMPVRGNIVVEMQEDIGDGVCGVTSNVISFITGASGAGTAGDGALNGVPGQGGDGAGAVNSGKTGGAGLANSITGTSIIRGGGGGGVPITIPASAGGSGGSGGGGNGQWHYPATAATDGAANTGSGGGGGSGTSSGHGGSGIVIIRYQFQ